MYVVRRWGSESWQENYITLENRKICECYVSNKIQEINFVFSKWSFFLSFFSLCIFSVYYFSFTLLTIIRTTKWQSTHIKKTSNINELITILSWRNQGKIPYWIFQKITKFEVIWSLFPQDNFCFISVLLFSQNLNLSVVMLTDLLKCNYWLPKTNRSYMRIFSIGKDFLLSNILKNIFVPGTSTSPGFKGIVKRLNVHVKS